MSDLPVIAPLFRTNGNMRTSFYL